MTDDCARLWQAVLGAALTDAAKGKDAGYLGSRDFEMVATLAGFDPDAVATRFEPRDIAPRCGGPPRSRSRPRRGRAIARPGPP